MSANFLQATTEPPPNLYYGRLLEAKVFGGGSEAVKKSCFSI